jgi:hypothetical protein
MTDQPGNDFDELLRTAAQEYNRPDRVPAHAMWEQIQARRKSGREAGEVIPLWSRRRWLARVSAAAAVLLIGVAIGRGYERFIGTRSSVISSVSRTSGDPSSGTIVAARPEVGSSTDSVRDTAVTTRGNGRNNLAVAPKAPPRDRANARGPSGEASPAVPSRDGWSAGNLTYRLAVLEHLAGTEAMLTSFRSAAKRGEVDAQITRWARDLLTTTRLLEMSPAQQDPMMKRLLGDLELVLLQIAQYTASGNHSAEELELIEHSIERRGVIGKLRTTIPARMSPAGT